MAIAISGGVAATHSDQFASLFALISAKFTIDKLTKILVEAFLLLPAVALVEVAVIGWRESSLRRLLFRRAASSRTDILIYLAQELRLSKLLTLPFGFFSFSSIALVGNGVLATNLGIVRFTTITDPIAGCLAYFLLGNLAYYWIHRAQHSRLLWPLHRMHHSADEMTLLTAFRHNIFSETMFKFVQAIPLSLLMVPDDAILIAGYVATLHTFLHHGNWTSDWGWFGRWVLVSPLHHRLHHSRNPDDHGTNFGTMLLWDHLFGTFRQPASKSFPLGVDEPAYRTTRGAMVMLVLEWLEAAGLAAKGIRGLAAPLAWSRHGGASS
jgi:sterol desaturase/sphingolipid hydroxylase (fatty acid hydroxylase superfamily)